MSYKLIVGAKVLLALAVALVFILIAIDQITAPTTVHDWSNLAFAGLALVVAPFEKLAKK